MRLSNLFSGTEVPVLGSIRAWIVVFCVAVYAVSIFPPALLLVLWLLGLVRSKLSAELLRVEESLLSTRKALGLLLMLPIFIGLAKGGFTPTDDFFRHATAARHGYDYTQIYEYLDPAFPHASMWVGYEFVLGVLEQWIGLTATSLTVQSILYFVLCWTLYRVSEKIVPEGQDRIVWQALFIAACLSLGLFHRALLARPEAVLTLWAISALWMKRWVWVATGLLLQPFYWLAIIYTPSALLLKGRLSERLLIGAAIALSSSLFWLAYAGTDWINFYSLLGEWMKNRHAAVSENDSVFLLLAHPVSIALIAGYLLLEKKYGLKGHGSLLLVAAWFMLPGQIRYGGLIAALLITYGFLTTRLPPLGRSLRISVILVAAGLVVIPSIQGKALSSELPRFKHLPDRAVVAAPFGVASFFLPAAHPGIRIAPAMELGATGVIRDSANQLHDSGDGVQEISMALDGQLSLDCLKLEKSSFTHVVERKMKDIPACVSLVEQSNQWRLWRVIR